MGPGGIGNGEQGYFPAVFRGSDDAMLMAEGISPKWGKIKGSSQLDTTATSKRGTRGALDWGLVTSEVWAFGGQWAFCPKLGVICILMACRALRNGHHCSGKGTRARVLVYLGELNLSGRRNRRNTNCNRVLRGLLLVGTLGDGRPSCPLMKLLTNLL